MPMIETKFYTFHQNNSGGVFEGPARNVIVEATSPEEANRIAQNHDVYFDGCDKGWDCSCCGDRWYPQWSCDEGTDVPCHYDEPLTEDELKDTKQYLVIRYGE